MSFIFMLICPLFTVCSVSFIMDGFGKAVVGVWRAHTVLDESDEPETSPEVPDRFRKLRSSSSLNSLRMSLRKRLPLRSVQTNSLPENPTSETLKEPPKANTVRKLTRTARNSVSEMCQVGEAFMSGPGLESCFCCPLIVIFVLFFSSLRGFKGPGSSHVRSV